MMGIFYNSIKTKAQKMNLRTLFGLYVLWNGNNCGVWGKKPCQVTQMQAFQV